jgi:hypothetical protein
MPADQKNTKTFANNTKQKGKQKPTSEQPHELPNKFGFTSYSNNSGGGNGNGNGNGNGSG